MLLFAVRADEPGAGFRVVPGAAELAGLVVVLPHRCAERMVNGRTFALGAIGGAGLSVQPTHHTLVVHGRDDRVIPPDTSLRLNRLIDRSELHIYGQCGHWVQIEAGQRFVELVNAFLSR